MVRPRRALLVAVSAGLLATTGPSWAAPASVRGEEWWINALSLDKAWPISRGAGVTVAVVDSGVAAGIPELAGAVLPGTDLVDRGQDGRTDHDPASHGTGMATFIAARGRGGTGLIGVAPEATILPIRLSTEHTFFDAAWLRAVEAIRYAADRGARVVNLSFGKPEVSCPVPVQQAVWYAMDRDVVVVAGAGNDGDGLNQTAAPALCSGVVAVGAVDRKGRSWEGTQRNSYVDVAAPGVDMRSVSRSGEVRRTSGTSDATAVVSGVVALVRARYPRMPARQVVQRIMNTLSDPAPRGRDDATGYGIVLPHRALTAEVPADAPNPVYEEVDRVRGTAPVPPSRPDAPMGGAVGDTTRPNVGLVVAVAGGGVAALLVLVAVVARRGRRPVPPPGHQGFAP